jgi:thioredoxin reductase (NADPH)
MHDVIIIGAGPAGITAAIWCDELGLDTLVLEQDKQLGGQLHSIYNSIQNYPAAHFENGAAFAAKLTEQSQAADFDLWTGVQIESIDLRSRKISIRSGEQLQSITIIIATGVRRRRLGIPGEEQFIGKGIIESGTRDREFFSGRDVCVIGGGDAAVENALLLAEVCPTVTVVHRGKNLRARPEFAEKLKANHCITVFRESSVRRILGDERVEAVEIEKQGGIKPFQMAVGGVLIRIGVQPNTELFADEVSLDSNGYVKVDALHETQVPNVFAIGDVANPIAPTIVGAAGSGATAAKVIASRLSSWPA